MLRIYLQGVHRENLSGRPLRFGIQFLDNSDIMELKDRGFVPGSFYEGSYTDAEWGMIERELYLDKS